MNILAFDVETSGTDRAYALEPFRTRTGDGWLTSFAVARSIGGKVKSNGKLHPTVDELRALLNKCAQTNTYITGWNTPFDVAWLIALGLREEVYRCKWLDGMLLYKHHVNRMNFVGTKPKSFGLKQAVSDYYPQYVGYEKDIDFAATDVESLVRLLEYNRKDAEFTLRLTLEFLKQLKPGEKRSALLEARCIPLVAEATVNGLCVDGDAAVNLAVKLVEDANLAAVSLKMKDPDVTEEALRSPAQLGKLLFDKWGLTPLKYTPSHVLSTDKEVLAHLADTDERAKLVHDYREAHNNHAKFAKAPIMSAEYNGDGRTRPSPRIFSTYTGRMTYSSKTGKGKDERPTGVALHQWKRGADFRRLIKAPEGYDLLEFDFAGQEFRWMGVESEDDTMLLLCAPGEDAHSYMGARIGRLDYGKLMREAHENELAAKQARYLGKVANLSLQYRTSAETLMRVAKVSYGVNMSLAEARVTHATYQTTYPKVPRYWKRQIYNARTNGRVTNKAGRSVWIGPGDEWGTDRWVRESTAINFPIQSIGADQKYLALSVLRDYLPRVDGRFYYELHDGLFIIVPHAKSERAAHEAKKLLSNLPYKKAWGYQPPIPFPVDAKIGPNWGALKEVA